MDTLKEKIIELQAQQDKAKKFFEEKKYELDKAKEIYIKCQGAVEVLENIIQESEDSKKDKKK